MKRTKVTEARIERTTDTEMLEAMLTFLSRSIVKMYRSAKNKDQVLNRSSFISLAYRMDLVIDKLGLEPMLDNILA